MLDHYCTHFSSPSYSPAMVSLVPPATTSQTILLNSLKEPPPKYPNRHSFQLQATTTPSQFQNKYATPMVQSYVKEGNMEHALKLFDEMQRPVLFLWNIMLRGYVNSKLYEEAIRFYHRMVCAGVRADKFTFPCVIKSCAGLTARDVGLQAHASLIKSQLNSDLFICNSLIAMYSKLGLIDDAVKVFDRMPMRDLVSWNSLIDGYVSNRQGMKALACFREFNRSVDEKSDKFGVTSALAACSLELSSKHGREIHGYVIRNVLETDFKVETSILDMYCKCGHMSSAEKVFDKMAVRTVITWNSLIGGYAVNKQHEKAIICLNEMISDNKQPDSVTVLNTLISCAQSENISHGKEIHAYALKRGLLPHVYIETALNDMYGKCGELRSAQHVFDKMLDKNLTSWNTMLAAYTNKEKYEEAIALFIDLLNEIQNPDLFTISIIVPAYAELASLRHGEQIHSYVISLGYSDNTLVMNSILHVYANSGDLKSARKVFDKMPTKDIITWNTIIMGYGIHGHGKAALDLFANMKINGVKPNESTFVSVLTACSVSGLANEGWTLFNAMQKDYDIKPRTDHYGCMVDLLGRTGEMNEILNFIENMPIAPSATIWGALLTASRNNNNLELAELATKRILEFDHDNTGCYVTMYTMYMDAGRIDDANRILNQRREKGLEKTIVNSSVELPTTTRNFVNGDMSHPECQTLNEATDILSKKIGERTTERGIVFDPTCVGAEKAKLANRHSARLAVVFALISTGVGTPVLVKKNARVCDVCHDALKKISKFTGREIVVGDSSIYHHFSQGSCCCGDYW